MELNEQEVVKEGIEHYDRMITWAQAQNPSDPRDYVKMRAEIGEAGYVDDCSLCKKFLSKITGCDTCLLYKKYGKCSKDNDKNIWGKLIKAKTWKEWIYYAELMLKQIESLL